METTAGAGPITMTAYYPGAIGDVTRLHATYYHEYWGFDVSFETEVARDLADFFSSFQDGRDGFWAARSEDRFAGAIAIDAKNSQKHGARLRWFIVDPRFQGQKIGADLIGRAMEFCRAGHPSVYLWTFEGLHAARRLYERHGFRLVEEHRVLQWGGSINEQKFVCSLSAGR